MAPVGRLTRRVFAREDRRFERGVCWSGRGKWDGLGTVALEQERGREEEEHDGQQMVEQMGGGWAQEWLGYNHFKYRRCVRRLRLSCHYEMQCTSKEN